ncbi:MAG: DUF5655 domain-containing protein, partial [Bdellovibrionia bacterium]
NQSLFYLYWLRDHKGDFQVAVNKALGKEVKVDWSDIRVICLAPGYKKYDLHAVQMMGASIELWQYRKFENGSLYLEEVFRRTGSPADNSLDKNGMKNPVMVEAGRKAAETRANGIYSVEEHFENVDDNVKELSQSLREFIMNLGDSVEEAPKKLYIAYKLTQNFVCMEMQKKKIVLYLKIDIGEETFIMPANGRDVSNIGHFGTGDLEIVVRSQNDFEEAKRYIKLAFETVGGWRSAA